jgi:tRNA-specific 2-thiouridylase
MRCLALFTGGLDSQIAVRLMQRQGIEVIGFCIHSAFSHANLIAGASEAAKQLQIELHFDPNPNLPHFVKQPRFGLADGMAPCLDCRSRMVATLQEKLAPLKATFLISGEVVGQRPSSLRSQDLATIAYHGNADDLLLRPLSAKLLPPTLPELKGWVDRNQLFDWHGKSRKEQIALAREWGLVEPQGHQAGCVLLEPTYAARLRRLLATIQYPGTAHFMSLKVGRHFWRAEQAHLVVAKSAAEGAQLDTLQQLIPGAVSLKPANFRGPEALLVGKIDAATIADAANAMAQFSKEIVPFQSAVKLIGWTSSSAHITQALAEDGTRRFVGFTE